MAANQIDENATSPERDDKVWAHLFAGPKAAHLIDVLTLLRDGMPLKEILALAQSQWGRTCDEAWDYIFLATIPLRLIPLREIRRIVREGGNLALAESLLEDEARVCGLPPRQSVVITVKTEGMICTN